MKMGTILMNSENNRISYPHRLLINLGNKINLKKSGKFVSLSNFIVWCTWKSIKSHTKTIDLKYQLKLWMKNLSHLTDHTLY